MNQTQLSTDLAHAGEEFTGLLHSLSIEQLDQVPFEGSWSAGQVGEHILKSVSGAADVVRGNVGDAGRPCDALVPNLQAVFLDFSTKLQSPDFILPTDTMHPKEGLINSLKNAFDSLSHAAATLDPACLCLDAALPKAGKLTRYEWGSFALYHTQRHIHQLKNIVRHLEVMAGPANL